MTGDYFRSIQYPNIDRVNGGSLNGMIEGLGITIGMAGPNTKIIPGHGATVDRAALIAHRDMILVIRDKIAAMVQQGKTVEEVLAAKPTSDYDAIVPNSSTTSERFVRQVVRGAKDQLNCLRPTKLKIVLRVVLAGVIVCAAAFAVRPAPQFALRDTRNIVHSPNRMERKEGRSSYSSRPRIAL